ncbi:hypothetical protein [Thermoanaerobacterium sp. RBIITD]|uniref:hypothetical protein n=1 Tax=Thermoanaerobacterium sp. RBIITD TaxID=1550240 RepID=UPI000BB8ECBD|nr:hypothetical protein [Thermoanaerobacterium sp. RBIITD]SNX55230.1 hypothetical protein SAMN05660242_3042 [Thermoanaerobacterium sp. RBIITD]
MKSRFKYILIFLLLFSCIYSVSYAKTDVSNKKVIVFIINRVTLNDYIQNDLPNIKNLINRGAYGLMTVNSDGGRSAENVFMTIGTGTRALGSGSASLNYNSEEIVDSEKASILFERNSGIVPRNGNILNLDIAQIKRNNMKSNHIVKPGLLGELLEENGYNIAVFGNEDTDKEIKRFAPLIGMDYNGIVPYGDVSTDILKREPLSPFGITLDYNVIYNKYNAIKDTLNLTIFDLGDTARANDYQNYALDKVNIMNRKKALINADNFIGEIIKVNDKNTLYMVITPLPPTKEMSQNDFLTPVIMYGPGINHGKFITSDTTKRIGVVTNMDILPTVLNYFGIEVPSFVTGHQLYASKVDGNLKLLQKIEEQLTYNYTYRTPFLKTYVALQIIILILSSVTLIFLKKYSVYMKPLLFFVSVIPLSFLLLPLFDYTKVSSSLAGVLFLTAIFIFAIYKISSISHYYYAVIAFITTVTLLIDMMTGSFLLKNSFLSYDVIAGARFYGIGNEYMGVLIGGTLCFTTLSFERFNIKKPIFIITAFIYLIVFYFIAAPNMGTNVGGGIAAFAAFSTAILLLSGKKLNLKNAISIIIGIFALILILFYIDSLRPVSQQTHIGQTFNLIKGYGLNPLFKIFARKLSMNMKLFRYSIWSKVLITLIIVLFVLFYKPIGVMKNFLKNHKYVYICFFSTIIGSIFALVFNDSGVVAAATMMVYTGPMIVHFIIDELEHDNEEKG